MFIQQLSKVKKLNLVFLIGISIVFLFASCTTKREGKIPGQVTLTYMIWGAPNEIAMLKKAIREEFEPAHQKIKVKLLHVTGNYADKLLTMIAGGTPPDVFWLKDKKFPPYVRKDVLLNLSPYIQQDSFDINDFYGKEVFTYQDNYYGIPNVTGAFLLFYNKNLFDEEGLAYPDSNWTWDNFLEAAKRLTKDRNGNGRIDQYGCMGAEWGSFDWNSFVWQNGGKIMDADATEWLLGNPKYIDKNAEALQFMVDLSLKHNVAPGQTVISEQIATGGSFFESQRVAMSIVGWWQCYQQSQQEVDYSWDVAVPPYKEKRAAKGYSIAHSIAKGSKHPKEAWEFVKWLSSPKRQAWIAELGRDVPARKSIVNSRHFLQSPVLPPGINAQAAIEAMKYVQYSPLSPINDEINAILGSDFDLMMLGKKTAMEAILNIQPKVEKLLAEQRQHDSD